MRDKNCIARVRAKKKLDHFLEAALPELSPALHDGHVHPYPLRQCRPRARLQDRIVYATLIILTIRS